METPLVAAVDTRRYHWRLSLSTLLASLLEDRWINLGSTNVFSFLEELDELPTLDIVAIIDVCAMEEALIVSRLVLRHWFWPRYA